MRKILTNDMLKIIAVVSMLIDHIGLYFFPNIIIFRIVGRLAFPIFAFLIAEGYFYTKNKLKYFLRLFLFAIIAQIPFCLLNNNLFSLNILFTFCFAFGMLFYLDFILQLKQKNMRIFNSIVFGILLLALHYLSCIIYFGYGIFGIILVIGFYLFRAQPKLNYWFAFFILLFLGISNLVYFNFSFTLESICQMFAVLAIPLIMLYNKDMKPSKKLKYLFYIFYPAHLTIIYLFTLI